MQATQNNSPAAASAISRAGWHRLPQPCGGLLFNTKPIPSTFRKNGWNHKLLTRNERAAIYTQSLHPDLPASGKAAGYEVIVIGRREAGSATLAGTGSGLL